MSHKVFGVDFGTDTLKIYEKGKGIIWNQKELVAITIQQKDYTKKVKVPLECGDCAYDMYEKAPDSIDVTFPLKHGVVADMEDMYCLWKCVAEHIPNKKHFKGGTFYIAVPPETNDVEKRAFYDLIMLADIRARAAKLIDKPVVCGLGAGIPVTSTKGAIVVDLGAETTEISILSTGGIVVNRLLPQGCKDVTDNIVNYIKKNYKFVVGWKSAELLRQKLLHAFPTEETMRVVGRNIVKGLPGTLELTSGELFSLAEEYYSKILLTTKTMLERTPPEISAAIHQNGVYLTGGGACIPDMAKLFEQELGVPVICGEEPQLAVIKGFEALLENDKMSGFLESKTK